MIVWQLPARAGARNGRLVLRYADPLVEAVVEGRAIVDVEALDQVCLEYLQARGILRPGWYEEARGWSDSELLPPRLRGWGGQHVDSTPMRAVDETHARQQLAWETRKMQITQHRLLVRLETDLRPVDGAVTRPAAVPEDQLDVPWAEIRDPKDRP